MQDRLEGWGFGNPSECTKAQDESLSFYWDFFAVEETLGTKDVTLHKIQSLFTSGRLWQ